MFVIRRNLNGNIKYLKSVSKVPPVHFISPLGWQLKTQWTSDLQYASIFDGSIPDDIKSVFNYDRQELYCRPADAHYDAVLVKRETILT